MAVNMKHTIEIEGTETGFTFGDLAALVSAGMNAPVAPQTPVRLHVTQGSQFVSGYATLTLDLGA